MPKDHHQQIAAASGCFVGRTHILPIRIYYEDTDLAGHVYHANYVRYLERGRSEFLRAAGMDHTSLIGDADPRTFVVTNMSMNFLRPAKVDDTLLIHTTYDRFRGPRVYNRQRITRGEDVVLEAEIEMAVITLDGRPARPSGALLEALDPYLLKPRIRRPILNVPERSAQPGVSS